MREAILFCEGQRDDINCHFIIDLKRQECVWSVQYGLNPAMDARLFYWFRLMANYKQFCAVTSKHIKLSRVCFSFPPPEPDEKIDYGIFGCEVLFNQPVNAMVFHRNYLLLPVWQGLGIRFDCQNWFALPGIQESQVKQVEVALARLQKQGIWYPTITTVAKVLGMQPRALRRRLASESVTFYGIRNRVRCEQAIRLLVTTDAPIVEIASQIGFSEPGDFTRAFKAWTRVTPSFYRARHGRAEWSSWCSGQLC